MRHLGIAAILAALLTAALPAAAQSPFSPVITINDSAITGFEIDQRIKLLEIFRTPGNLPELAREQLVEDRLKQQELDRVGLQLTDEGLRAAMEEFAGRANLTLDQFLTVLEQNGVAEETLRDYVEVGIAWRDYIRQRYSRRVNITDADIEMAIAQAGIATAGIEVLLSEIIIPAPPPEAERAMEVAQRIAQLTSFAAFESAAREVSALPSRDVGGRLPWTPLSNFPPALHGLILGLAPGEVTPPIPIENGVALFQLREVREGAAVALEIALVDYAAYYATGGAAEAQQVVDRVDTCDDLYGVAFGQPPERLDRRQVPPAEIAQDIALELARLDPDEVSTRLTTDGGATVVVLMLCGRTPAGAEEIDREGIANRLRSERLAGFADALVEDLRAAATIVGQ